MACFGRDLKNATVPQDGGIVEGWHDAADAYVRMLLDRLSAFLRSGKHQHLYMGHTRIAQRLRGCQYGSAARHHIVYQHDALVCQFCRLLRGDGKGPVHIAQASSQWQAALRLGMAHTQQGLLVQPGLVGQQGVLLVDGRTQRLGQQQGLVEAALCQAQGVQGHGDEPIAVAQGLLGWRVLQHQLCKSMRPTRLRAELEAVYALLPRPGVRNSGVAGIHPSQRLAQTIGTQGGWAFARWSLCLRRCAVIRPCV